MISRACGNQVKMKPYQNPREPCKTQEHILVSNINIHLALDSILADCKRGFRNQRSCKTQLVQFVHNIISNLDGAVNRGHKQTDLILMDFAKALTRFHTGGYYTHWNIMGLEDPPQVDQLAALWAHSTSCFGWPSLRSSPSAIRCAPGIGPRTGPVPHLHK